MTVYRTFPRLVGECGGKNYHLVHPSAKEDTGESDTLPSPNLTVCLCVCIRLHCILHCAECL